MGVTLAIGSSRIEHLYPNLPPSRVKESESDSDSESDFVLRVVFQLAANNLSCPFFEIGANSVVINVQFSPLSSLQ